jgi:hypothetical protein
MEHAIQRPARSRRITIAYVVVAICLAAAGLVIALSATADSSLGVFEPTQVQDQFGSAGDLGQGGGGDATAAATGAVASDSALPSTGLILALPFFIGSAVLLVGLALRRRTGGAPQSA